MNELKQLSIRLQMIEIKERIKTIEKNVNIFDQAAVGTPPFSQEECVLNDDGDHWLNSKLIFGIDSRYWRCEFCGKPFEN